MLASLGLGLWTKGSLVPAVQAAELSRSHVLGFSGDGRYFVFEEFGIQDGSGTPYVNLFAIDVEKDAWLKGTPVRLKGTEADGLAIEKSIARDGLTSRLEINGRYEAALSDKRRQAKAKASSVLSSIGKLWPPRRVAHNPAFEFTNNSKTVRFSARGYTHLVNSPAATKVWRLEITEEVFAATENCFNLYDDMKGFSLTLTDENSGKQTVLNRDTRIPKSRMCPQGYHIEEVLVFPRDNESFSLAVLVRYGRPGFEGPDGRLLAVTYLVTP